MKDWGVCKDCTFRNDCRHYKKCKIQCEDYKQECEQTNEEWLRGLSFNELARVLYCMIINGERIRPDLTYIKQWLKQPHNS